jgi:glycosyltransferase involved in cell wall biosynthesis
MYTPNLDELPPARPDRKGWPWTKASGQVPEITPDGRPWPKISVVTPSYNQGEFIEETIRSVLLQGYPNLEYVIIDGGSTDSTVEVIHKYERWLSDWVSEEDKGQADAINKGWGRSTGEILAWINSDDTYCLGALAGVAEIFSSNKDIVVVSGAANTIDVQGKRVLFTKKSPDIDPYAMLKHSGGVPTQPSVFFRRRVLGEVGFLNSSLHLVMDWEFWIRVGLFSNNRHWSGTKTLKGWRTVCEENRYVFDRVFSGSRGDRKLQCIRRSAYSASYRKQAYLAWQNGDTFEAIKSLTRSWTLAPLAHNPFRELGFLVSVILNSKKGVK